MKIIPMNTYAHLIIDMVYPVGSYYWSSNATNPSSIFGGTWEQIKDRFVLAAGDSYKVGATGGEAAHTLTVDEMPAHSHDRGTMNITGNIECVLPWRNGSNVTSKEGAFSWTTVSNNEYINSAWANNVDARRPAYLTFNAADTWTGNTSSAGRGQAHNNMPPYIVAYCWHRIA